jgi:hypothetical protein
VSITEELLMTARADGEPLHEIRGMPSGDASGVKVTVEKVVQAGMSAPSSNHGMRSYSYGAAAAPLNPERSS